MIGKIVSAGLLTALFVGSVVAAGATVRSSYQSAQMENRLQAALARKKVLQEDLAYAQSLHLVVRYAEAQGYVRSGQQASVQLSASLAQR